MQLADYLHAGLLDNNHHYPQVVEEKFLALLQLVARWNRIFNLTAIHEPSQWVTHHLLDSLAILPFIKGQRVIDIGSGAGFPGIPLAIALPQIHFCLLDSNGKKTRFLTQVIVELGLKNVEIQHSRAEDFLPIEKYDQIVTRAFAALNTMVTLTKHLLKENGEFLAMKGHYPNEEIKELPVDIEFLSTQELTIHGLDQKRCVVRLHPRTS